ncbi:transcriptional repressor [bacterium]|jgi:Fur family transcriptional regulator, ferric uptake regulator|nr:transcriptional repressor [bacterium]MBT4495325.1 transcriptional repressor [bacterium]MBT4763757.1 transcriptional repressor [bacterium]MBT5401127.1 transcriptional repressor [bacterium]MBT5942913.1 transcriptional repressor [bacterium]
MILKVPQGKRLTKQRSIILEELKKNRIHPTALEVHKLVKKRLPKISLATIYRNLKFLQSNGYIMSINCESCNSERFDGFTDHHQHFSCKVCQKVYDMNKSKSDEVKVNKKEGHQVDDYQIIFNGICKICLKKEKQYI